MKKAIEWILNNRDGHYAADSVVAAIAHGAAAAETSQESEVHGTTFLPYSAQRSVAKGSSFQGKSIDAVNSSNMSKNFRLNLGSHFWYTCSRNWEAFPDSFLVFRFRNEVM